MLEVVNRTAVITGGGAGIGRALALEAARAGMHVAICDVSEDGLAQTAAMVSELGVQVVSGTVDVRDIDAVRAFAAACGDLPDVALLWANAGVLRHSRITDPDLESWNFVIDVNLKGVIHTLAAFVPGMVAKGKSAQVVLTGSLGSFSAAPNIGSYIASKHAVWGLADTLRMELQQDAPAIGVSLLAPQRVATGIIAKTVEKVRESEGEAGVEAFLATLPTAETIAAFAWEGALAGKDLIVPDAGEASAMIEGRMTAVAEAIRNSKA